MLNTKWRLCAGVGSPSLAHLHLGLDPGPDDVGLCSKLASQPLVGLLPGHLLLEHLVSEWNKVLHLRGKTNKSNPQSHKPKPGRLGRGRERLIDGAVSNPTPPRRLNLPKTLPTRSVAQTGPPCRRVTRLRLSLMTGEQLLPVQCVLATPSL